MTYEEATDQLVDAVAERLDTEPKHIKTVTATPRSLEVVCYALNDDGAKFIHMTGPNEGTVALEVHQLPYQYDGAAV